MSRRGFTAEGAENRRVQFREFAALPLFLCETPRPLRCIFYPFSRVTDSKNTTHEAEAMPEVPQHSLARHRLQEIQAQHPPLQ